MFCKIGNHLDLELFQSEVSVMLAEISEENQKAISESVEAFVAVLCDEYGEKRNSESVGGFVMLLYGPNSKEQREKILSYYNLTEDSYEYRDLVCQEGNGDWVAELFVMSTDYNLVLLYRRAYE